MTHYHPHHEPEPVRRSGFSSSGTMRENQRIMAPNKTKVAPNNSQVNHRRAWRPLDDAFRRPQSSLPKNHSSFPKSSCHGSNNNGGSTTPRASRNNYSLPPPDAKPCPICCEDMDTTDLRFLPCSCGFRVCLFCHKRILEEDGRCPGCRKLYDQHMMNHHVEAEVTWKGAAA